MCYCVCTDAHSCLCVHVPLQESAESTVVRNACVLRSGLCVLGSVKCMLRVDERTLAEVSGVGKSVCEGACNKIRICVREGEDKDMPEGLNNGVHGRVLNGVCEEVHNGACEGAHNGVCEGTLNGACERVCNGACESVR